MKHSVRFIDKQAAELGFFAQGNAAAYADMVSKAFAECPPRMDRSDERVELMGRIIYAARKIDEINGGRRKLWE